MTTSHHLSPTSRHSIVNSVQSMGDNSLFNIKTKEEKELDEYNAMISEVAGVVFPAIGQHLTTLALSALSLIRNSDDIAYRAKNNILHDYTKERDVLPVCDTIGNSIDKYWYKLGEMADLLSMVSRTRVNNKGNDDAGEMFMDRIEISDQEFASDYRVIRDELVKSFRPLKCSDPVALYALVETYYYSSRFDSISRYFSGFADGFKRGDPFAHLRYFNISVPLQKLISRCHFTDKSGRELHFVFNLKQLAEYEKQAAKRSWQIKYRDNAPVLVKVWEYFHLDNVHRAGWRLETHYMEIKTIDRIIEKVEGKDPHYRDDYKIKRIQTCASTFEQAQLYSAMKMHRWESLPRIIRSYIDSHAKLPYIDARRKPKPIVAYRLKYKLLPNKNIEVIDTAVFHGIWNSISEASVDLNKKFRYIEKALKSHNGLDVKGELVFYPFAQYVQITYQSMLKICPDVAQQIQELCPEYNLSDENESHLSAQG